MLQTIEKGSLDMIFVAGGIFCSSIILVFQSPSVSHTVWRIQIWLGWLFDAMMEVLPSTRLPPQCQRLLRRWLLLPRPQDPWPGYSPFSGRIHWEVMKSWDLAQKCRILCITLVRSMLFGAKRAGAFFPAKPAFSESLRALANAWPIILIQVLAVAYQCTNRSLTIIELRGFWVDSLIKPPF